MPLLEVYLKAFAGELFLKGKYLHGIIILIA